ncbi:MAG: AAA family ATPase, partial [Algicola sp.]|nr:AAA family ATPase [Algicola sp.]
MTTPLKYPLGIQTFSEIREENYLYVDKTGYIYDLITTGKVYFLSRPRRFGKSLLISTFEALFSGQKDLFEGLDICETDCDFLTYPIAKLEFSQDEFRTADSLRDYIYTAVDDIAQRYDVELTKPNYSQRFGELISKLHDKTGQKVVLLVDEYDKPILNNLNKPVLEEIKQVMSALYSVIKPLDPHLKFVFITGVSKFAKISVIMPMDGRYPENAGSSLQGSGMNSLTDISMERQFATLCGI